MSVWRMEASDDRFQQNIQHLILEWGQCRLAGFVLGSAKFKGTFHSTKFQFEISRAQWNSTFRLKILDLTEPLHIW